MIIVLESQLFKTRSLICLSEIKLETVFFNISDQVYFICLFFDFLRASIINYELLKFKLLNVLQYEQQGRTKQLSASYSTNKFISHSPIFTDKTRQSFNKHVNAFIVD